MVNDLKWFYIQLIIGVLFFSCNQTKEVSTESHHGTDSTIHESVGTYFGKFAPIKKAEVFMDGIISKEDEAEMCAAFTLNGDEFYYNKLYKGKWTIFVTRIVNNKWTNPEPINFTVASTYTDRDFTISPDGNKLYFGSDRSPIKGKEKLKSLDIYVSTKIAPGKWSSPRNLSNVINTEFTENYPSVDSKGNLYFFSCRKEGLGGCEIYCSKFKNGKHQKPELLDGSINSSKNDWDSFIAPDGSYIIFSSQNRSDTHGNQDLYISYKDKNGDWTVAKNMGLRVNSTADEICPSVSLNSRYFFFTTRRRGKADIFWIDAKIIEDLKPNHLK